MSFVLDWIIPIELKIHLLNTFPDKIAADLIAKLQLTRFDFDYYVNLHILNPAYCLMLSVTKISVA